MCTQLTPFNTIWPDFYIVYLLFINVYPINSFQDHMTWFLHCVPKWLLSRPFDLILSMCTQLTPFKTIWPDFYIVYLFLSMCTQLIPFKTIWPDLYPIDFFKTIWLNWFLWRPFDLIFYQCVPNWLLSRPYDLIFTLCTYFYQCVPNWLLSRPYDLILSMCIKVYPIDSFQDHMTWFLHCVPLSRPYDLNVYNVYQLTPFKTIWPNFINVYPIDSFQDHMTWFLHCVPKMTPFKTIWPNFINVYPIDSFQDHMT